MDEVQIDLLKALDQIGDGGELISERFASDKNFNHQRVVGAIKSLQSQPGVNLIFILKTIVFLLLLFCPAARSYRGEGFQMGFNRGRHRGCAGR